MAFLSEINTTTAEPCELSLFSDPPNQVALQKIYFSETRPVSSLDRQPTPTVLVFSDRRIHERKMCHSKRQQLPVEGLFKSPLVQWPGGQLLSPADAVVLSRPGQFRRR